MQENVIIYIDAVVLDKDVDFVDDKTFNAAKDIKRTLDQQISNNQQVVANTTKLEDLEKKVDKALDEAVKEL